MGESRRGNVAVGRKLEVVRSQGSDYYECALGGNMPQPVL
jgi:hypothetical protein